MVYSYHISIVSRCFILWIVSVQRLQRSAGKASIGFYRSRRRGRARSARVDAAHHRLKLRRVFWIVHVRGKHCNDVAGLDKVRRQVAVVVLELRAVG